MHKPDVVIDLPGLACPQPVLKAKRALKTMQAGQILEVRSSDKHSLPDLKEFCDQTGHHCVAQMTADSGETPFITQIQRKDD